MRSSAAARAAAISVMALGFGAGAAENAIKCRSLDAPDAARLVMAAPDISLNGVPMEVRELYWSQPPAALLDYYRALWKGNRASYYEKATPEWQVISTVRDRCIYSVQVKPQGTGSYALLGVTHLLERGATTHPGRGFPMLPGSKIVNDIVQRDSGKGGRTLLLVNDSSLQANLAFYRSEYASQGWQTVVDRAVPAQGGPMNVLVVQRGPQQASLTLAQRGGGVTVVANVVDGR